MQQYDVLRVRRQKPVRFHNPWPLQIKAGDYCLLHHYEIGGRLGLWQATCDGGKGLVPKMRAGTIPYQVREILERFHFRCGGNHSI